MPTSLLKVCAWASALLMVGCGSSVQVDDAQGAGGAASTAHAGGSDSVPGGGGDPSPGACANPDATPLIFNVTATDLVGDGFGLELSTPCIVEGIANTGFQLRCTDAELGEFMLTTTVDHGPTDLMLPLGVNDAVRVHATHYPAGHHMQPTTSIVVLDPENDELLWAAVSFQGGVTSHPGRIEGIGQLIGNLDLAVDATLCPGNAECGEPMQRLGIRVSDGDHDPVTVMDADRRSFSMGDAQLDLWVGTARASACLNVGDTYHFILAATP